MARGACIALDELTALSVVGALVALCARCALLEEAE